MDIKGLRKNWDEFGKTDPLWAVLTFPDKKGKKWDINDFYETGVKEIEDVIRHVESHGIHIPRRKALDFGCGVGRLTQALAKYFDEVYGVDIAPSMIELANKYNRYGERCKYLLNDTADLKIFPDDFFDFIYTNITLQHMAPRYSKKYIKEFLRVLAQRGLLIFQLPSHKTSQNIIYYIIPAPLRIILKRVYFKLRYPKEPIMEIYSIRRDDIVRFLGSNNAEVIDIQQNTSAGKNWINLMYCVRKK
ncbi:MAG: class I SAM-dependent methyltransferase [Candidatus Omnitrophica bacterium]|nr:class I SAM-dependent methyltransferase [Candidatus Omnitrophota bacterium]